MPILHVLILAVVQGLTEFLPVSSKTHLLFAQALLGMKEPDLFLIVALHAGSLAAILLYYRRAWLDLLKDRRREIPRLVLGTVPAVAAVLFLKERLEPLYGNLALASGLLILNGAFLFLSEWMGREREGVLEAPLWKALAVGLAQACALLPGISRSGSTIGTACLLGFRRGEAVRFSFFLGAVAISGALAFKGRDLLKGEGTAASLPILLGVVAAFAVSLAAIKLVENLSLRGKLSVCALYCALVGTGGLVYYFARG
jgi:undecaprenyl-diphosphatase